MTATVLYRIAAVIFVLFAAGHTVGFMKFKPPTAEGQAVQQGMETVQFQVGSKAFTYGGFYRGFGLSVTVYLLLSAYLAWYLGGLASANPAAVGTLGWVFCFAQVAILALSWIYFFPVAAVFAALVVACLGWAAWVVG